MDAAGGMSGKVCMITGADSGIGKATALGLAGMRALVVMVSRDRTPGERAKTELVGKSGSDSVELMVADLSSQRAIRRLAADFKGRHEKLHVLVNNAGVLLGKRPVTEDGIEKTFAVNHLAPFLLTNLLSDVLKASAPARIVNVACEGHRQGEMDFDDLMLEKKYSAVRAYNRSKLANVLFTYELARRLRGTGVTANCLYPGMVATDLFREAPALYRLLFTLFRPFLLSPKKGAETSVYLASSPELEGVSGKYFAKKVQVKSSEASYDESLARRVWELSAELAKLS